ncbi:MAG: hypothetical protein IJB84_05095, partial [Lachnospiraceae bacterium]|nr:hypothetical protein [Lachnospiraceae bacterium]
MKIFSNRKLALLLVLSLVLSAVPFPGNVETAYATEAEEQVDTDSTAEPTESATESTESNRTIYVDENYNDMNIGDKLSGIVTEKYSWTDPATKNVSQVVSKDGIFEG